MKSLLDARDAYYATGGHRAHDNFNEFLRGVCRHCAHAKSFHAGGTKCLYDATEYEVSTTALLNYRPITIPPTWGLPL